ncbi:MAG: Ltp family lipoprotein, partial [Nocardioides sp.]
MDPKAQAKADKAYAKASRPWYQKKRWWLVGTIVLIVVIAAASSGGGPSEDPATVAKDSQSNGQPGDKGAKSEPAEKTEPEMTSGQENALQAGQNYIDMMGFSREGLIRQLSS